MIHGFKDSYDFQTNVGRSSNSAGWIFSWLVGKIQIVPAFSWELDQPIRGQSLRQRLYLSCSLCRTNIVCYPSILWTSLKWYDLRVSSIFFWLRPRSVNLAFSSLDVLQPCKRVEHLDPTGPWFTMVQKEKYRSWPGPSYFSTNLCRSTPIGSAGVSGVRDYDPRLPSIEICMVQASGSSLKCPKCPPWCVNLTSQSSWTFNIFHFVWRQQCQPQINTPLGCLFMEPSQLINP